MTQNQYEIVKGLSQSRLMVRFDQLRDPTPRTLVFGYDLYQSTCHVYTNGKEFVVLRYQGDHEPHTVVRTQSLTALHIPSKRAYPEACDFEMASLLKEAGVEVKGTQVSIKDLHQLECFMCGHCSISEDCATIEALHERSGCYSEQAVIRKIKGECL